MSDTSTSPARSDAVRNRAALVHAARAVFAEEGLDAALGRIAERAGVGRASLYRHFADRESLVLAIFEENFEETEALSRAHARTPEHFLVVFDCLVQQCIASQGFVGVMTPGNPRAAEFEAAGRRLARLLAGIRDPAVTGGVLDASWSVERLVLLVRMLCGALATGHPGEARSTAAEVLRLVGIVSAGDWRLPLRHP